MNKLIKLVESARKFADNVGYKPRKVVKWYNIDFDFDDERYEVDEDGKDMRELFNMDTGGANFYPCEGHWNIRSILLDEFVENYRMIYRPPGLRVDVFRDDVQVMENMFILIENVYPKINRRSRPVAPFKKLDFESFCYKLDKYVQPRIKRYDTFATENERVERAKLEGKTEETDRTYDLTRPMARIEQEVYECMHEMITDLKGGLGTILAVLEIAITEAYRAARKKEEKARKREERRTRRSKRSDSKPSTPTVDSEEPPVDGEEERAPAEAPAEEGADFPADGPPDDMNPTPTVIETREDLDPARNRDIILESIDLDRVTDFLELYCRYHAYRLKQVYLQPNKGVLGPHPLGKVRVLDHWQTLYVALSNQRARDKQWKRMELWTDRLISLGDSVQLAARMETFFGRSVSYFMEDGMEKVKKNQDLDATRTQLCSAAVHFGFWPQEQEEEDGWDSISQYEPSESGESDFDKADAPPVDGGES